MKEEASERPNSDDPRDRILRVAATLFAHKGYAGTSTREIIEAARVTKPTLYYHFKSKRSLYLTILGEAMRIFHDRLNLSVTPSADMRMCLRSLFSGVESLVRNDPDVVRLVNAFLFGTPSEIPCWDLHGCSQHVEVVLTNVLRKGVEEREILEHDLQRLFLLILGMLWCIQSSPMDRGFLPNGGSMKHYFNALDLILPKPKSL